MSEEDVPGRQVSVNTLLGQKRKRQPFISALKEKTIFNTTMLFTFFFKKELLF